MEAEAARMMREVEAEAARMEPEIKAGAARIRAEAMHQAAAVAFNEDDTEPLKDPRRVVWREDYVAKEDEGRYLSRRADGLPNLYLADAGDRLAIWSPVDGGGLINPKGPGIRRLGLYASYARGADHYRSAYRAADLSKGTWIDLVREPENPHDTNAVAMCAPGSRVAFAYVQRGRAPAVARRMDAGEDMAAVSMRGPGDGRDDDSTFVLVGSRSDLTAMLDA
ncbi:MAG TPA: HIRAN domain-containing protein [Marmoricola sp.]|nr:HIRAN domain-containing protein [Marmoricola sp.]